jgi:glucose-6-phosphate-specific signal transduction histidine kinase
MDDLVKETAPFLIGLLVPPLIMLATRPGWTGQTKFLATLLPALVLGFCTSTLAGELLAGMPDALISVLIDTSLVFTGSQLAYRLVWKPLLEPRLSPMAGAERESVRVRK